MSNVICAECNAEVNGDVESCSECGFPFESLNPVKCPQCSNLVVFSSDACPVCGLSYEEFEKHTIPKNEEDIPVSQDIAEDTQETHNEEQPIANISLEMPTPESNPPALTTPSDLQISQGDNSNPFSNNEAINMLVNQFSQIQLNITNAALTSINKMLISLENSIKEAIANSRSSQHDDDKNNDELISKISKELNSAASSIIDTNKSALKEMDSSIKQSILSTKPTDSTPKQNRFGDLGDYILYICIAMLLFTVLNMIISAYAVRLLK